MSDVAARQQAVAMKHASMIAAAKKKPKVAVQSSCRSGGAGSMKIGGTSTGLCGNPGRG